MGLGAGQVATDADLAPLVALLTPTVVTTAASVGTVATGFTVNDVRAAVMGPLVNIDLFLSITTALTVTTGNIPDVTCFTLNSAYWPSHYVSCSWGTGTYAGEANVQSDGLVRLRTATDGPVTVGQNVRLSATYIQG